MADKTFRLEVVSPDSELYSGDATFLVAQTTVGELGILASHAPMLAELAPGGCVVVTESGGNRTAFAVQGGFLSVTGESVTVLAEHAQFASDIDVAAERSVLESADEGSAEFLRAKSRVRAAEAVG
ncbi:MULTISPECIES: F0F1 ATP synthase subunit epsilon [Gordonia]|uniref:ATP synthase epsilon chain n=2 Tax=Gordonia TaxID=2053 RepID=L7LIQ9_9ACTN|nr:MULTISPECIES: F0F1 ATP synthase subunit epsilon [Gordonia]AUH69460.1 F0F1 ATP synthase subunit epsilon [Gordonia sp. YC-JH1]KJR07995.1 ATP synthase F0F1 subunit epsilon [Gordonia sihwensis]KXT56760.1 ATP synthase F0F1 subunit epsilon [Gordonia sp. QH-12]MBY4569578.1 ATP synthase F1 subunit epsilon [Gordonia sihwensis]WFN94085.1 F0F1 ATP synthase subunit epsilon [Gordonia sihwensis]